MELCTYRNDLMILVCYQTGEPWEESHTLQYACKWSDDLRREAVNEISVDMTTEMRRDIYEAFRGTGVSRPKLPAGAWSERVHSVNEIGEERKIMTVAMAGNAKDLKRAHAFAKVVTEAAIFEENMPRDVPDFLRDVIINLCYDVIDYFDFC